MNLQNIGGVTLSARIADELRNYVLAGGVAPGERLTEIELAERLGVSRGPLREALLKLADERLLIKEPYKGIRVRDICEKEVRELYSLRTNLEQFAFRECWPRRTDSALAELKLRLDRLAATRLRHVQAEVIDCEIAFHSWVFEFSDHTLLQESWANIIPLLKLYLSIHAKRFGPEGAFASENEAYYEIAQGDDLNAMLDHVSDHMRLGLNEVIISINGGRKPK